MSIYVDTSALAKRYVDEADSVAFDDFATGAPAPLHICPLTVTEFHSVLMRRCRLNEVDLDYVEQARGAFAADMAAGLWVWNPFPPAAFGDASLLIQDAALALSTLDALHLACAQLLGCTALATADRKLARAAAARGLAIHPFAD